MKTVVTASGVCSIYDTTNNITLLEREGNAIHPLNLAVALGRGLAGMPNGNCYKMAFGRGGTTQDGPTFIKNEPNIGKFSSRLYNETYSEIIDATAVGLLSTGDGTVPENDEPSVLFQTGPGCFISVDPITNATIVKIVCHMNSQEPRGQDTLLLDEGDAFEFDEIGIFTSGKSSVATPGYQYIDVDQTPAKMSPKNSTSSTGLTVGTASSKYFFRISINGESQQLIKLDFSGLKTVPTYGQLVARINTAIMNSYGSQLASASISDTSINTFGYLKYTSTTTGNNSTIALSEVQSSDTFGHTPLFVALGGKILPSTAGQSPGVALNFTDSSLEAERLICHLRFNPIKKARNVSLKIEYEISLTVNPIDEI